MESRQLEYVKAPRPISANDDVSGFDCGVESLNSYLRHRALKNDKNDISRCYVVDGSNGIIGYYSLSAASIYHVSLTGRLRRNSPDPAPAILLTRLAVDSSCQGMGLGWSLLQDATRRALAAADIIGARIFAVEALDDKAKQFYLRYDFVPSPTDPLHLIMLINDIRRTVGGSDPIELEQ